MRSALSISLPGARRRGQLALLADEATVFVPEMMAAQKSVATTPSITIETAGIGAWLGNWRRQDSDLSWAVPKLFRFYF